MLRLVLANARSVGVAAGALAACFVALFIAFVAVLALAIVVGDDVKIAQHLREGVTNLTLTRKHYPISQYGDMYHSYDMFTECVGLGTNLANTDDPLLYRIVAAPNVVYNRSPDAFQPCIYLVNALEADQAVANNYYLRFWHGYQAYVRPMLTVFSLENMHRMTALILFGIMIFYAARSAAWFGAAAWPVVLLPFFLIGDFFTVPTVTVHALHLMCSSPRSPPSWCSSTACARPILSCCRCSSSQRGA